MGGPLKLYDVVMHGVATRMKLNEADAQRYSGTLVGGPAEPEPEAPPTEAPAKSRTPANKSRTARGKAVPGGD